jgi:hypothetical protein
MKKAIRAATLAQGILVLCMILFSILLVKIRVVDSGWNEGEYLYQKADLFLAEKGALPEAVVMVRNPPAYFIMTGRQAIVIPFGDVQSILAATKKYRASYVILEEIGATNPLYDLYMHPESYPGFILLGAIGENLILSIESPQ